MNEVQNEKEERDNELIVETLTIENMNEALMHLDKFLTVVSRMNVIPMESVYVMYEGQWKKETECVTELLYQVIIDFDPCRCVSYCSDIDR